MGEYGLQVTTTVVVLENMKLVENISIASDKSITEEMLPLFAQYCESEPLVCYATDIGLWKITITDTNGKVHTFKGSLCGGVSVGNTDMADYLREHIPTDCLFVFGDS